MSIILISLSELFKKLSIYSPFVGETTVEEVDENFDDEGESDEERDFEKDPFDLSSFPRNIFNKIAEKLDFAGYIALEETSQYAANFCQGAKFPIPFYFIPTVMITKKKVKISWKSANTNRPCYSRQIPWVVVSRSGVHLEADTMIIDHWISSSRLKKICRLFERDPIKVDNLIFKQRIRFEPEDLGKLLKATKPECLIFDQFVPKHFFKKGLFDSIHSLRFDNTGFGDEELAVFSFPSFCNCKNDFVTAKGLNRFLKQWKRGERDFDRIYIEFDSTFNTRPFEIILEGLDANPLWTPDLHGQSLIAKLPIEEFGPMDSGDPPHMYALWVGGKATTDILIVELMMGEFYAYKAHDPCQVILGNLNMDQYYEIFDICRWCLLHVCYHRRKYSTHRFKKANPLLWKSIMFSIKAATWTTTIAHYPRIILNSYRIVNRPNMENGRRHFHEENPQNWAYHYWLNIEFLTFKT